MRKLKLISCIIILCVLTLGFLSIKKTYAISPTDIGRTYILTERDQSKYNFVTCYDVSNFFSGSAQYADFFGITNYQGVTRYYLSITGSQLRIIYYSGQGYTTLESYSLTSRLLQIQVVYDVSSLYLIVYQVLPSLQTSQGLPPSFAGFNRSMLTRFNLSNYYDCTDDWQTSQIYIIPYINSGDWSANGLYNSAYISPNDSIQDINQWCDLQMSNSTTINYILNRGYNEGYSQGYDGGYNQGVSDGEDVGYENGYDDGYDSGYSEGTIDGEESGYIDGYNVGYDAGYLVGYDDGTQGETIFSPFFAIMQQIFGAVGQFLAIEIAPNLPLGIFVFVPLFFGVVGLILWIWRRN